MDGFFYIVSLVFAFCEICVGGLCLMLAIQSKRPFEFIGAAFVTALCIRVLVFIDLPVIFAGWPK